MIERKKCGVLGAGPSGLTIAHALLSGGRTLDDIVVIERQEIAGGLCRSEMVAEAPLDIGGGHFLDVRRKEVLDFVFRFLPREEWDLYDRVSRIRIRGMEVDHPLEANLWQFPLEVQPDYLESIAQVGLPRCFFVFQTRFGICARIPRCRSFCRSAFASSPLSVAMTLSRLRGRPRLPVWTLTASSSGNTWAHSSPLAGVTRCAKGIPVPSVRLWIRIPLPFPPYATPSPPPLSGGKSAINGAILPMNHSPFLSNPEDPGLHRG